METIVVLSGSGLSAESGLPTFRDTAGRWRAQAAIRIFPLENRRVL